MFEKNLNIAYLLDFYGEVLPERKRTVMEYYNQDDLSLAEIAECFDISRQGVRSVLKKSETILLDMENKLNLASRFLKMRDKSTEIASKLLLINKDIDNTEISSKISSLITEIEELADY